MKEQLEINLERDVRKRRVLSGGYAANAHILRGGRYKVVLSDHKISNTCFPFPKILEQIFSNETVICCDLLILLFVIETETYGSWFKWQKRVAIVNDFT